MTMTTEDLRTLFKAYLDDAESQLESDNFLPGLDVTADAAKELLEDIITYGIESGRLPKPVVVTWSEVHTYPEDINGGVTELYMDRDVDQGNEDGTDDGVLDIVNDAILKQYGDDTSIDWRDDRTCWIKPAGRVSK